MKDKEGKRAKEKRDRKAKRDPKAERKTGPKKKKEKTGVKRKSPDPVKRKRGGKPPSSDGDSGEARPAVRLRKTGPDTFKLVLGR